jgi:hypothetical protein
VHNSRVGTLQSLTGKYRGLQGNTCNENRDPAMRTGVPGFSLWELAHREFPVSYTGFGFIVPGQRDSGTSSNLTKGRDRPGLLLSKSGMG